jgi:hypothetical protein
MRFDVLHCIVIRVAAGDFDEADESHTASPPQFVHGTIACNAVHPWQDRPVRRGEPAKVADEACKRLLSHVLGQVPIVQDAHCIRKEMLMMAGVQSRKRTRVPSCQYQQLLIAALLQIGLHSHLQYQHTVCQHLVQRITETVDDDFVPF